MGLLQRSCVRAQQVSTPTPFATLQLPPVENVTVETSPAAAHNQSAQAQFDALTRAAPTANIAAETIDWFSATTGIGARREFRVVAGVLQENRPSESGTPHWVNANTINSERAEPGMQHLFLADGQLYRSDGTVLGRFGVNSSAQTSGSAGQNFLRTFGTLHDPSGRLIDYSAATLTLGGQPTLIQLGPPPGMVAILRPSTSNVLVESNGGSAFREIPSDTGFQRVWVHPSQAATGTNISFTREQVLRLPLQNDGCRYSPDGRLRFTFNSDGVMRTEARLHVPTNWRDSQGLCMARVSWVVVPPTPPTALPPLPGPPVLPAPPIAPISPTPVAAPPQTASGTAQQTPGVTLMQISPTDAEAFFQLFLTTCRLSDLQSDVGRGLQQNPAPVPTTPRLIDPRTLVQPNSVAPAADAVRRHIFDFSLQLRQLPQEGIVATIAALNEMLQGRIAGGGPATDAVPAVMRADITQPPQAYCQQVGMALAAAHTESNSMLEGAISSMQLLQPAARASLLNQLREATNQMPHGIERDQRVWQLEMLDIELQRRAGVVPLPALRPRPLPVS